MYRFQGGKHSRAQLLLTEEQRGFERVQVCSLLYGTMGAAKQELKTLALAFWVPPLPFTAHDASRREGSIGCVGKEVGEASRVPPKGG